MDDGRIIKVFEDYQKRLDLSEEEKRDILQMKSIIGEKNLILQADGKLTVKHYVGYVQLNKTRLLIYPKIASSLSVEKECARSFGILLKMLSYSGFINIRKTPTAQMMDKYYSDLLELFIGLFAEEILLQLKRDVNRGYKNKLENQSFIKGKLDFTETVKNNSFRKHLHYIRYDQFNENILLNQVLKSVAHNLISRTQIRTNKIKLKQVLLWLEDVEMIQLSSAIWEQVQFTRQNFKYKPAFNLAKMFYYNTSPGLNKGDEYTFSFLVPVNQLFEKYLYQAIKTNISSQFRVGYQGPIEYLARHNGKNFMKLKPDITLSNEKAVQFVIDAKYKKVFSVENGFEIAQSDIYQMLAYSIKYKCNEIFIVYPKFIDDKGESFIVSELKVENYEQTVAIKILKMDLEIEPEEFAVKLIELTNKMPDS